MAQNYFGGTHQALYTKILWVDMSILSAFDVLGYILFCRANAIYG